MVPPDQTFRFSLSAPERQRLRKLIFAGASPPWYYPLMVGVYCLQFVSLIARHPLTVLGAFELASFAILIFIFAWETYRRAIKPRRRIVTEAALELTDAGLTGTIEGVATSIGWNDIARVMAVDGAIVFVRRSAGPLALPTSCIADPTSLWAFLEDRLISKRGLILSKRRRTLIYNSAYPQTAVPATRGERIPSTTP